MHAPVVSPPVPVITVPSRQRLEQEASYLLGTRFTLRWSFDTVRQRADGFDVLDERGLYATVTLAERSAL